MTYKLRVCISTSVKVARGFHRAFQTSDHYIRYKLSHSLSRARVRARLASHRDTREEDRTFPFFFTIGHLWIKCALKHLFRPLSLRNRHLEAFGQEQRSLHQIIVRVCACVEHVLLLSHTVIGFDTFS